MDKKELRRLVASAVLALVIFAICISSAVLVATSGVSEIQLGTGSKAYDQYLACVRFSWPSGGADLGFAIMGSISVYLGLAMLVTGIAIIVLKRAFRYVYLPIAGFISIEVAAFLLQAFSVFEFDLNLGEKAALPVLFMIFAILLYLLGFACLVLTYIFPRRFVAARLDDDRPLK